MNARTGRDAGRPCDRDPRRPDDVEAGASLGRLLPVALLAGWLVAGCGGDNPMNGDDGNGTVEGLDLTVGEVAVREAGDEVLALELPAGSEGRVYDVAVQVDAQSVGLTSMRLAVEPGSGASGSVSPSPARRPTFERGRPAERWTQARDLAVRVEIQENAKRLLRQRNIRPARSGVRAQGDGGLPGPRLASRLPSSLPAVGDTIEFWYPVQEDLRISCDTDSAEVVSGEVKAVGQRAVMVEDTTVADPSILGESMNYDSLAQVFDDEVFGIDETYFGSSTDIDGNDRIYVLFTTRVNDLTEPDDDGIVSGFFLPTDLADSGDSQKEGSTNVQTCDASNEAEVLYLLAPDPEGEFGKEVSVPEAKRSGAGTSAHEFQHLLNTGNRVIDQSGTFADLEDTWLDEALSHLAEEVVGLGQTGDPIRDNLTLARVVENQDEVDAFNTYHLPNFARLAEYMRSPEDTRALALEDPQGIESLKMRGFVWSFLRWLTDQEANASSGPVPGTGEEDFIRDLAQADGGLEAGVANVEAVTGRSWSTLLEDFGLVLAVDDTVASVGARRTFPTWNLRDVFLGLHENSGTSSSFQEEYPLDVAENAFTSDTLDFEVQGGTQKYVRFDGSNASGSVVIRLSNQSGTALGASSGARLLIVRTR